MGASQDQPTVERLSRGKLRKKRKTSRMVVEMAATARGDG